MNSLRNEIQQLRGVSILAVLCFHLYPSTFKNGFLGVDVFFVISGYLITKQLVAADSRSFATYLSNFYFRRLKRIIPSAISIVLLTLLATYFLLGIVTFVQNLDDAKWANLFLANWFYLHQNLNYFATGNINLFQHYWSLAIEEQFYLFWPLILFFNKRNWAIPLIIFSASLWLYLNASYPSNFYSTTNRVWELLSGALLVLLPVRQSSKLGPIFPIVLMIFLLLPLNISPKGSTILIVFATSIYIAAAKEVSFKGPLYALGQISFTLYLVHFPIIKIYDDLNSSDQPIMRAISIFAVITLATLLNYKFIENKFRYRNYRDPKTLIFGTLITLVLIEVILISLKGYYV